MKTIKVIDLLNKLAKGEEGPKDIYWRGEKFEYINGEFKNGSRCRIMSDFTAETLNEEIEIIEDTPKEDKKIEKLDLKELNEEHTLYGVNAIIVHKINEIIDKINGRSER